MSKQVPVGTGTRQPDSGASRIPMDIFHQEQDALRTLLITLISSLERSGRVPPAEIAGIFTAAQRLLQTRWGKNSIAEIVLNGCREDTSMLTKAVEPVDTPGSDG